MNISSMSSKKLIIPQDDAQRFTDSDNEEDDAVNEEEEKKEIAFQLAFIRKKHDQTKQKNQEKQKELDAILLEIETVGTVQQATKDKQNELQDNVQNIQQQIILSKQKFEAEMSDRKSYEHMLNRIKKDQVSLESKANLMNRKLAQSNTQLDEENKKLRTLNEARYQSKLQLDSLKKSADLAKRKKDERIVRLERSVRQRQDAAFRRESRQKKQTQLIEAAESEDKESQEVKMREKYIVHKFWHSLLKKRLLEERDRSTKLEQAYGKIKLGTGMSDMGEIVERFLTKEKTYAQMLQEVESNEKKLEEVTKIYKEKKKNEGNLQFDAADQTAEVKNMLLDIDSQVESLQKQTKTAKLQKQKFIMLYDKIRDWGLKLLRNLYADSTMDIPTGEDLQEESKSLKDLFSEIATRTQDKLALINQDKEAVRNQLTLQVGKRTTDVLSEISVKEFMVKNQRVKPESDSDREESPSPEPKVDDEETIEFKQERSAVKLESSVIEEQARKRNRRKYYD